MEGQFIAYGLVFELADVHTGQTERREEKTLAFSCLCGRGVKGGRGQSLGGVGVGQGNGMEKCCGTTALLNTS